MALYHMHCTVVSRSSGRSSVAAAAYRSGTRLVNLRDGVVHDYSRRRGVARSEIILPDGAPARWLDRSTLWNDVERAERGASANLCREIEYALPRELSAAEKVAFARSYARTFAREGMCVDYSIHDIDGHNPHVHQLTVMRPCDGDGFTAKSVNEYLVRNGSGDERKVTAEDLKRLDGWSKVFRYKTGEYLTQAEAEARGLHPTRDRKCKAPAQSTRYLVDWNEPEKLLEWRERLATMQNRALEAAGHDNRVDHRSYAERGIDRIPTIHEGPAVTHVERAAEARATREGRAYEPVTPIRRLNVDIKMMNERLEKAMEKLKRSYMEFRRSLNHVGKGRSINRQRRLNRASRQGRHMRGRGGMSK